MIKKRLTVSLIVLIGSAFLFVFASFAWFAISDITDVGSNIINVVDIDVSAELYVSDDGTNYTSASSIDFQNVVPGDIKYYKIVITNNNDFNINTQVSLHGFTDSVADSEGDDTNYLAGKTLLDVLVLNASNNVDSNTITNQTLTSLLQASSFVVTHESVAIAASGTAECYFSFTVSTSAGNDYQNLKLDISNLFIQSVEQG